jgi:hypothetical protein
VKKPLKGSEAILHLLQSRSNATIEVLHNTRTERTRPNGIDCPVMQAN